MPGKARTSIADSFAFFANEAKCLCLSAHSVVSSEQAQNITTPTSTVASPASVFTVTYLDLGASRLTWSTDCSRHFKCGFLRPPFRGTVDFARTCKLRRIRDAKWATAKIVSMAKAAKILRWVVSMAKAALTYRWQFHAVSNSRCRSILLYPAIYELWNFLHNTFKSSSRSVAANIFRVWSGSTKLSIQDLRTRKSHLLLSLRLTCCWLLSKFLQPTCLLIITLHHFRVPKIGWNWSRKPGWWSNTFLCFVEFAVIVCRFRFAWSTLAVLKEVLLRHLSWRQVDPFVHALFRLPGHRTPLIWLRVFVVTDDYAIAQLSVLADNRVDTEKSIKYAAALSIPEPKRNARLSSHDTCAEMGLGFQGSAYLSASWYCAYLPKKASSRTILTALSSSPLHLWCMFKIWTQSSNFSSYRLNSEL